MSERPSDTRTKEVFLQAVAAIVYLVLKPVVWVFERKEEKRK